MPQISVIVPIYNVEAYLARCIDSILSQTFTDFELILVDDGSPDNCGKICDEYAQKDERIIVCHRENGGAFAARNFGIEWVLQNSNSQWLTFIDSDDWIHPDYLKVLYSAAYETNAGISICNYTETSEQIITHEITHNKAICTCAEDIYVNHQVLSATPWAKLYRKTCFQNIRYPAMPFLEDEFTTYKVLFEEDTLAYCDEALYYYFINTNGISKTDWSPKYLLAVDAYEEQIEYFRNKKFDKAYKKAVFKLLWYLVSQLENASKSAEYKSIHNKLKQDLKKQLKKYENEFNLSISKNSGFYEAVYPKRVKLYWLVTGIINKIKKVFLCHKSA